VTAPDKGFFKLRTPRDLLEKARRDLGRRRKNPLDEDAAFDFFVTARHVPDWLAKNGGAPASDLFNQHVELRICRHIADGAKHFEATHSNHKQVDRTDAVAGGFRATAFQSSAFQTGNLWITLDPSDAATISLGSKVEAVVMAERILAVLDRAVP
jgi:hypothetical protein